MRRDAGGAITALTKVDAANGETSHTWPSFLPDGRHLIFLVAAPQPSRAGIWITSLDDPSTKRRLLSTDTQAIVIVSEQAPSPKPQALTVLYLSDLVLMVQPIDPVSFEPAGRAAAVGLPAGRGPLGQILATASSEVLIYAAPGTTLRELRWVTRDGI